MTDRASATTVFRFSEPTVDASNRRRVEAALRDAGLGSRALILDWSNVVYVDCLGMEIVLDFIVGLEGPIAFAGMDRSVRHLLHRMQLLRLIPHAASANDAADLLGIRR